MLKASDLLDQIKYEDGGGEGKTNGNLYHNFNRTSLFALHSVVQFVRFYEHQRSIVVAYWVPRSQGEALVPTMTLLSLGRKNYLEDHSTLSDSVRKVISCDLLLVFYCIEVSSAHFESP